MIWVLGALVFVLLALLVTPLRLELALGSEADVPRTARLTWAWGLVQADLAKPRSVRRPRGAAEPPRKQPRRGGPPRLPGPGMIFDLIGPALTLIRRLWRATHPQGVHVQARLGLADPAETGMLWALIGPALLALDAGTGHAVEIEPDFAGAELHWAAAGRFTMIPAEVFAVVLAFGLSAGVVRTALHVSRRRP